MSRKPSIKPSSSPFKFLRLVLSSEKSESRTVEVPLTALDENDVSVLVGRMSPIFLSLSITHSLSVRMVVCMSVCSLFGGCACVNV